MKKYNLYIQADKQKIENNTLVRVDLFNDTKIRDIKELKQFSYIYETKGHDEENRKIRYLRVFNKF